MERMIKLQMPIDDLSAPAMTTLPLNNQSVATSSGIFRGVTIGSKKYSHLLDPRTGYPVEHIRSVTVVSPHAIDADALATACSILSPDESLALIESMPNTSCFIIDSSGRTYTSLGWQQQELVRATLVSTQSPSSSWNGGMELKIDFTVHQPDGGNRYRRPYVAVWIEDKDGFSVRTLVLWTQAGKGSRWLPDLKRWYRSDRLRKFVEDTDMVVTVSEATRKPGVYSVIWNGEDDQKNLVGSGEYTLYIEAAREHGTYQLIRKKLEFTDKPFQITLEENIEIKAAAIDYRKLESPN